MSTLRTASQERRDREIEHWTAASGANGALTVSTSDPGGSEGPRELIAVIAQYSAVPVQAGVTVTLNSAQGAAYDGVLNTGAGNAQLTVFLPTVAIPFNKGDAIDVLAPAGGGVITSQVTIITRRI